MRFFKLHLKFFIIGITLFVIVVAEPKWYVSASGKQYLIEADYEFNWMEASYACARRDLQLILFETDENKKDLIEFLEKVYGKPHNLWLGVKGYYIKAMDKEKHIYWQRPETPIGFICEEKRLLCYTGSCI